MNTNSTPSLDFTDIDESLSTAFPAGAPGVAVIVTKDRQVLLRKGYGLANLEWALPVTPDTVFRIGSVTKQFTAVAILMLVEQGKINLQDSIEKFLPGYPTHGHTIAVEHLLTHTSGIKSYTGMKEWRSEWGRDFSIDELIDFFKFQPMDFAPGQRWNYNNSAYFMLAAIIEKASGISYDQFLQKNILEPLGLKQTCLELPGRIIPKRAAGYEKGPAGFSNAAYISMTQPLSAGGMVSTVDDLACWDATLYEDRLISPASLCRAHTPYRLPDGSSTDYGYGWGIHHYEELEMIEHGGGIHGFSCHVMRVPSSRVFAAVLTNSGNPAKDPAELTFRLVTRTLGLPFPEAQPVEVSPAELAPYSGEYAIEGGPEILLTLDESRLWLTWPGQTDREALIPVGEGEFVNSNAPLNRLYFLKNETEQVTGLEIRNQYGKTWLKAKRAEKALPGA
jgi:CubicO group peptidase (beta-lactamase class C family)